MKLYFKVKNWDDFQHYKDRNPPWIKLHNHLLDDYDFECLGDAAKGHLLCIWMLASRTKNLMPFDVNWISKKIGSSSKVNLKALIESGFLVMEHDASTMLHNEKQDATVSVPSVEESRGETEERQSKEELMSDKSDCDLVITHLNTVLGTKYKSSTKSHIQNINARLSEGHSIDDLKAVIDFKFKEWGGQPSMSQYLRPQTLFGTGKFHGYLTSSKTVATGKHRNINDIGTDFSQPTGFKKMKFGENGEHIGYE